MIEYITRSGGGASIGTKVYTRTGGGASIGTKVYTRTGGSIIVTEYSNKMSGPT